MGPNTRRLIVHKMSLDAVPRGGGVHDALRFLTEPGRLSASAKNAQVWVEAVLAAVRSAPGNPHPDDEAVAAAILAEIARRKKAGGIPGRPPPV